MRFGIIRASAALLLLLAYGCDNSLPDPVSPPVVEPPSTTVFPEGLWTVSGNPSEIVRLDESHLLTAGRIAPDTRLFTSSASLFTISSVAFDNSGVMWVASHADSAVYGFAPTSENPPGFITPKRIIEANARSIAGPTGMAFARDGALWVANYTSGTIVRFDRTQLASSGAPVPSVTITGIAHPTGLAFDASGALWVTDILENTVSRYLVGQLLSSGDKPPAVVLSASDGSLNNPGGIAFDSFNNMWVANTGGGTVVAFRPPQRGASGSPSPFTTLGRTGPSLGNPVGLAFDPEGNLWIMNNWGTLSKFSIASIAASGPSAPDLQIEIEGHAFLWSIAFWPKPSGFPLN